MFKLVVLTVLLAVSESHAFWAACPGILAPTSVSSAVCSGASCTVSRGQPFTASAQITFNGAFSNLHTRVTVFVLGIGVEIPQDNPNTCDHIFIGGAHSGCPTTPNVQSEWRISMSVSPDTPIVSNARVRCE